MEKILIEYVCPSLELLEESFYWNSLNNDDDIEAF